MHDFWQGSGYGLLERDAEGSLKVTEAFLRAYLKRPEMAPVDESCAAERALHAALEANPREAIGEPRIAGIVDEDARENYRVWLNFRDRLVAADTVEACYLNLFEQGPVAVPPLFLDQMVQVIVRGVLDGTEDPFQVRAGELFFRPQSVTVQDGAILLGDTATVEMLAATRGLGDLGKLLAESGTPSRSVEMDVLLAENSDTYWGRSDAFDMVLDLTFARPGLDALCRVMEAWIDHMVGAAVSIQPVQTISDERWVWHIGLDVEASTLLNDLYEGTEPGDERLERLISLFRMEFRDANQMRADIRGRPVYLALSRDAGSRLRFKPQNLLVNLPLAAEA